MAASGRNLQQSGPQLRGEASESAAPVWKDFGPQWGSIPLAPRGLALTPDSSIPSIVNIMFMFMPRLRPANAAPPAT